MPVHDRSRSERNPEQLVQDSPSTARSLRVQSQQLPTESQIFQDEVLAGKESTDHPAEEMSKRGDHGQNLIEKVRIGLCAKSFILQMYDVLARHSVNGLLIVEFTGSSSLQHHSPRILVGYPGRKDRGTLFRALLQLGLESGPDGIRFRRLHQPWIDALV
jgi:hypothetical protein